MILGIGVAEKLLLLMKGNAIPASSFKSDVMRDLVAEGLVQEVRMGRSKCSLRITDVAAVKAHLFSHFSIGNLEEYVRTLKEKDVTRAALVEATSDSKSKAVRSFPGFLVNVYEPVTVTLNGRLFALSPEPGTFIFIHDFQHFSLPADITVVGIENPENFRMIDSQQLLFKGLRTLFVSRYPQQGSHDLIKWLTTIPNHYMYFGDFDFAAINIYFSEYKRHLGEKATFFLPEGIEALLKAYGNRNRYDYQQLIDNEFSKEPDIVKLIALIHRYKKGLDQEILIRACGNSDFS